MKSTNAGHFHEIYLLLYPQRAVNLNPRYDFRSPARLWTRSTIFPRFCVKYTNSEYRLLSTGTKQIRFSSYRFTNPSKFVMFTLKTFFASNPRPSTAGFLVFRFDS